MAIRISSLCRGNCGRVIPSPGFCAQCLSGRNRARRPGKRIYETPIHKSWRQVILSRDPICVNCHEAPSVIADHIKPLAIGGTWDYNNGRGLCRRCDGILGARYRFGN